MISVDVKSKVLEWAIGRSGRTEQDLEKSLAQLPAWRRGEKKPTFKQLEKLAQATRTPIGFFFLPTPPSEVIPIPDLRTLSDQGVSRPSANLLETIYQCQQRQAWYEAYAVSNGHSPLAFIGSASLKDDPVQVAKAMRHQLAFRDDSTDAPEQVLAVRTWEDALRQFVVVIEEAGVMVCVSGVVGCSTSRKLDVAEFRGFALSHPLAPLIFVNGADSKSAQMFTLAHELAHLWLGQSALSNVDVSFKEGAQVEQWCNQVAAEFLVPIAQVPTRIEEDDLFGVVQKLTKDFKVSSLVVLRRLLDSGAISEGQFWAAFQTERERLAKLSSNKEAGGQFYPTHAKRIGRVLGRALAVDTLEGKTSFTEAFRLMAVSKLDTFEELARRFGVQA